MPDQKERHVLSVLVENEPGVLSRVVGLFSGRGYNIHSLNVAPALEEGTSHMTITTFGDEPILEQITKQLHKLVPVIKVSEFKDVPSVEREMMFVKVQAEGAMRGEILRTVVVREFSEIYTVAAIIALRAALTFLIHWEIKNEEAHTEQLTEDAEEPHE